ncbi:phage tail protein [Escherichia coli]|uniref:phage tail protein n=2 Tax=Escherichia coli TaxID=562 RepID=UPI00209B5A4E|nr:tail fiber protein [Escherichia coli]MCO7845274.1 tail fiber protein [Escherichia coli]
MGADKTNNIMTLSSGVSQPLLADVQYFELYSSLALNRKLKNIVLPGFYCGFEPVPGTGLSVRITSENSEGKGAASVDVNNVQISVQQIEDVTVSVKAGATNIIVLEANFEHGVKTTQVDSASSVSAARIYARTDNTIGQNQIELCRVIVPSGATAVTKEMIVLKYRVNRAVGVEFSNEISSTEERKAATPLAVKTLHDLVDTKAPINSPNLTGTPTAPTATKGTNNTQIASTAFVMAAIAELVDSSPDALNTLNELAAALGNDPNFSATVTRLIGEKVAKDGDTMTGKLNLPQTSAFGINTNNRLGGNSLTLGDDDTGIKQEGDGALSVFANGQRVFLFTERSITSLKELLIGDARYSTGGDVYGSQWGDGWLSSWLSARFAECANASHNHPWSQITDVPAASLTQSGIVQLSSAINSSSETLAATPKAVKAAYDLANGKYTAQDATTAQKGIVQLSSATNSASETLAATPKAVKAAYDLANGKYTAQDATTARKGLVQLSSATNSTSETLAATPKAVKAVMDETNKKAPLNSPALTGTPTTPTAPQGTNNTQIASTAFVMAAIAALVDSSPDALNTLNELAAALGNDPNFATTMTNALAGKQSKDATLTALAELATSADKLPYFTGADRAALTALTSVGRAILGKTSTQGVLDYLGLGEGSALPVGVPVPWPSATPPTGWLKCNGAAFSSEKYPNLAKVYPTNKLPDLRGEFIRGWDDSRGIDTGRSLLSGQTATFIRTALQDYYGVDLTTNVKVGIAYATADSVITVGNPANPKAGDNSDYVPASSDNSITGTQRTAEDNFTGAWISMRPRNVAFNYIVRAT